VLDVRGREAEIDGRPKVGYPYNRPVSLVPGGLMLIYETGLAEKVY
jgi:hypothetical protein